jgi:hypothetical protein
MMRRSIVRWPVLCALSVLVSSLFVAAPGNTSSDVAPLSARRDNVELVSKLQLSGVVPDRIADVTVAGNYAYLAATDQPACAAGGVYVVDISDVHNPREVGFIATGPGSFVGEGQQVISLHTSAFRGDVLLFNNQICGAVVEGTVGGATLVDVTDPRNPAILSAGFGDLDPVGAGPGIAHEVQSAFAWTDRRKAYAVLVDDIEKADVDIFDITDPRNPTMIAEYDLSRRFPQILQAEADEVFLHDMVVKQIRGRQIMLASYWDAGYLLLDVSDPANIRYVADLDYAVPDRELSAQTGDRRIPEGNGSEAEFTRDNKYILAADEDFSPNGLSGTTDDGARFPLNQGSASRQLQPGQALTGTAVYVGRACVGDPAVPPAPATGGPYVAITERGVCSFTVKATNVEAAGGYAGTVVVNREGADACGAVGLTVTASTPVVSVTRRIGFGIFDVPDYDEEACRAADGTHLLPVAVGTVGDLVNVQAYFDGWGYVHLLATGTGKLRELDTYAIPEAMDPQFATGFGALSVHEVATSDRDDRLAYLAYYDAGFRVIKIDNGGIREVGAFIDEGGSDFWGVEVFNRRGREYVAASDRDFGLYIFRYSGRR